MSDRKSYYYIRVKENFFESEEMMMLQALDEGYLYSDILMKLYLKSLKNEGKLMFKEHIPYSPKMLSVITGHSISIVEKALQYFREFGLIEVLDNGAIYMLDIQLLIGKTSSEGDRKKEYRARIRREKEALKLSSGQTSDEHPPEREIERELEKEKELELETELETELKSDSSLSDSFCNYIINLGFTLDKKLQALISDDVKEYGQIEVKDALSLASSKGKNYSYAKAILRNRKAEGKIKVVSGFEVTREAFSDLAKEIAEEDFNNL